MVEPAAAQEPLDRQRQQLVADLRSKGHLRTGAVAGTMGKIPREEFLPASARAQAYWDQPLSIGEGQTISAPHMVAIMTEALLVAPGQRILEIGTGSGYQAAVLSRLVGAHGRVTTIERHRVLAESAERALARVGARNVRVIVGDGSLGHPEQAPYDRIIVTAAAPKLPPPLAGQLAMDGVILVPVGSRVCELVRARKTPDGLREENLGACAFVPLKGAYGQRPRFFKS